MKAVFVTSTILAIICVVCLIFVACGYIFNAVVFNQNCGGYLGRAANANTIELAKGELKTALDYAKQEGLTSGYTSILWKTPDEDIGFWYKNLAASYMELCSVPEQATQLEKSNILLKLRESVSNYPPGISVYPRNAAWGYFGWVSFLLFVASAMVALYSENRYW